MGTGRTLRKKPRTRPIKRQGDRRRRDRVQKARLIKLGMDESAVGKLQADKIRDLLRHPDQVKKSAG